MDETPLCMRYTNWRGETTDRVVLPVRMWFGTTSWHPDPQWFLSALDTVSGQMRDFAMSGIQNVEPPRARTSGPEMDRAQIAALGGRT